ncbi:hypothetical protein H2200_010970 [Cladophialophora chaetospira]|uniref:Kelch repeat protein n=1 Tax=Cladophialophora chaetospira TaxID=386627 RepID=A0AA38X168_9EURO|nr:hypothetical protein H2200_010970 [Cladophialophora chaetospira]
MEHEQLYLTQQRENGSGFPVSIHGSSLDCSNANLFPAVATDDLLYIAGGEMYEADSTGAVSMYYQASTIAIDITQSWSNQTVGATVVQDPDGMIFVRQPLLFYDKPRNKVSRYGGWPYEESDFPSILWSFTAGTNNVNWKNETSPSLDGLSNNSPGPFASAHTYTDTTYYNFGGNVVPPGELPSMTVLSGLVTRNLQAQSWANSTADLPNQSPYRTQARMVHAPNFGGKGFLVMVGGESPPTEASTYETGSSLTDMATITLYDIESQTWFTQTATGDIPPPRSEFCAVGAASSSGRHFEVFVYGGSTNNTYDLNAADDEGYLNVYTLSLPAFRWFKSNSTTPARRACHTCSVIGKRQMISVGGRLPSSLQALGYEQDPWASGIGVFDMTEFAWVDHYDAAAKDYVSPDVVKAYYQNNYEKPAFSDPTLASVFAFTPLANSSNSTSPNGSNSSDGPSKSSSNTGAIVGGVVGGIAVIAAILFGVWFFLRRRKQQRARAAQQESESSELYTKPQYTEEYSPPVFEADPSASRSELDSSISPKPQFVAELPGDEQQQRPPHGAVRK